jgi:two-component system nitrate/nitrite response regulator NarL
MKEYLLSELTDVQENQESNQDNLSTRETEILKLIGTGLTNKEIAKRLYISFYTVETHRKNIVRKLNVRHGELVRYAVKISNGFS